MAASTRTASSDTPITSTRGTVRPSIPTAPANESPEVSAVRAYDEFADKARAMCPSAPVTFTALDWNLPRTLGDEIDLGWFVHGGKRVHIRMPREKAERFTDALVLLLQNRIDNRCRAKSATAEPIAHHPV